MSALFGPDIADIV